MRFWAATTSFAGVMAAGKEWMLDSDMASGIIDAASSAETDVAPPIRFVNLLLVAFALAAMLAVLSIFSYFEICKPAPHIWRIGWLMRRYVRVIVWRIFEVTITAVMARLATGI